MPQIIQPYPVCWAGSKEPLAYLQNLVVIDKIFFEVAVLSSLERLCAWVLDLKTEKNPEHSIWHLALTRTIQELEQALAHEAMSSVNATVLILKSMCGYIYSALSQMQILTEKRGEQWGFLSSSLKGWLQMQANQAIVVHSRVVDWDPIQGTAIFMGRSLSGATWNFLEESNAIGLSAMFAAPLEDLSEEWLLIKKSVHSLIAKELWSLFKPPGRVWQDDREYYLMWPLAFQDLAHEMIELSCPFSREVDSKKVDGSYSWAVLACFSKLASLGCLATTQVPEQESLRHPILKRPVKGIAVRGFLRQWIEESLVL